MRECPQCDGPATRRVVKALDPLNMSETVRSVTWFCDQCGTVEMRRTCPAQTRPAMIEPLPFRSPH